MNERVKKIHEKSLVMDGLAGYGFPYMDILAGGINVVHVTLDTHYGMQSLLADAHRYYALMEMAPDHVTFVQQAEDMLTAKKESKLAWIPTEADVSNKILSKVIILGHPAWEEVSQLQNL
jgi:hypothetical protein